MKGPSGLGQILTAAVALSSTVSAWPKWLPDIDSLIVRADDTSSTTATAEETGTATTATATTTGKSSATTKATGPITTNLNTGGLSTTKGTGTGENTATGTDTSDTKDATHTTYNAVDPAGGISMITPATAAGTQLYRIGETITWVWNYTSLQGTPTAIDVLVSCSTATETWTITQNMTWEQTGSVTWDTNAYKQTAVQSPLLTEEYTLLIYDADSQVSATAEAGYLSVYNSFTFGMYASRPYSNLSDWQCVTCSAANGDLDRKALGFAFSMAAITVLSFTWFVVGFGALL